jgi:radical SAM protein with 4Fe4S-binding SPASM domain
LNTRNSSVTLDSSGLKNVEFRNKVKKTKSEEFYCAYRRLNQGVLLPNGEVTLCCQDYKLEYILGDLKKQNLDNLYQKIQDSKVEREHFISGSFYPCTNCEHYRPLSTGFTGHL